MNFWRFLKKHLKITSRRGKRYHFVVGDSLKLDTLQTRQEQNRRASDQLIDQRLQFWGRLSRREQEVTAFTCLKYTNKQIAARLGISPKTVKTYLETVCNKLGQQNKTDLRVFFANLDFSEFEKRRR